MSGYLSFNWQRFSACISYTIFMLAILLLWSCGGSDTSGNGTPDGIAPDASQTGSASFSIQWHSASGNSESPNTFVGYALSQECIEGVTVVSCQVYDGSGNPIASGGPWPCRDHGGSIERIPAGPDRRFAVLGWNTEGGQIVYQGTTTAGIDITVGETADAGTIDANPFVPTGLGASVVSSSQINLSWNGMGAAGYRVYQNGTMVATTTDPIYEAANLTPDTDYCYTISALDAFENESGPSTQACRKTPPADTWFRDSDSDSFGDPNDSVQAPAPPIGYVANNSDCDDTDDSVHPNAGEVPYNSKDDDCNTNTPDDDLDGDGYLNAVDCDDNDTYVNPGANEVLNNGKDDDCDPGTPDSSSDIDDDGDGVTENGGDCDDNDPARFPGNAEICDNKDNNCNNAVDEGLSQPTTCGVGACTGNTGTQTCTAGVWSGDTCDEFYGSSPEVCDNVDNDCDGDVDEDLIQSTSCGVGACRGNTGIENCTAGIWTGDTCDEFAGSSPEVCDSVDNDCDGEVDENLNCTTCYPNLPLPNLELTDKQRFIFSSGFFWSYNLTVTNSADYPNDMFVLSPAYPQCGDNSEGSRTIIEIFDNENNLISAEYCMLTSPSDMAAINFSIYDDNSYPTAVYIRITDRACNESYLSNMVTTNNSPPTISNANWKLLRINDDICSLSLPYGSLYEVTFDYTDRDGNGPRNINQADMVVAWNFPDGGSGQFTKYVWNSSLSGNGSSGTATTWQCYRFGNNAYVDVTMTIEDISNATSKGLGITLKKPAGAN